MTSPIELTSEELRALHQIAQGGFGGLGKGIVGVLEDKGLIDTRLFVYQITDLGKRVLGDS